MQMTLRVCLGRVQPFLLPMILFGMLLSLNGFAQSQTVTGKIISQDGSEPLPGVNIIEKGTQNGTVSAADGSFTIRTNSDATLVFSFIGYVTQEVAVANRSTIDVTMSADLQQLSEVVVIGYGTQKKADLTGSVGSVNAQSALEGRQVTSVEQGLQGQAAGVQVVQGSGQPGGRNMVRIRGQNSIMGGNDPLYVVDGVPVQSGSDGNTSILATLNQNDIESMEILKDASATAIYGARGSNGVILITTKRGKSNQTNINFESSIGVSQVIRKLDLLDSRQFVTIANERATNDGQPLPFPDVNAASQVNTDWQKEVFQNALAQNYGLSIGGGNESTKYFVSGNYTDQEGAVINSGFKRGSFRLNLDQKASERLSFTSQIFYSRSVANRTSDAVIQNTLGAPPIQTPYQPDGSYTPGNVILGYPFSDSGGDNPVILAKERLDQLTIGRFLANVRAKFKVTNDLTLELMGGTDNTNNTQDSYSTRLIRGVPDGSGGQRRTEAIYYVLEGLAQYNKSFGDKHKINATLGFTRETQTTSMISAESAGFVTDDFQDRNLGAGARYTAPQTDVQKWDILSFLGRVNYTLADKYLLTVSGRRDGSSRFGTGNKWGFFPSAAFAWRVANEDFMQSVETISDLKLRLSVGKTGNQAINPYQSLQQFTPQQLVIGTTNAVGFAPANLGNPNLKWETTQQLDAGIDVGLFDQRLTFTLDVYRKKTSDLLAVVNVPPTSGFATTLQNIGTIENKGFEFTANYHIFRNPSGFNWSLGGNISANRNKVLELSRGADIIVPNINFVGSAHILRVGQPVSSFYAVKENGLTANGLINYVDQTGDGLVNSDDRVILGDPYPDFIYGINSQMSYKNFDFSIFMQGEAGKQLFNANKYYLASSFFRGTNNLVEVEDRWRPDDQNVNASHPKASANTNFQWSDRYVEDASYFRVKNILIGYTHKFEQSVVRSLRVFVSGQNLLTFTKYSWFNPDVNVFSSGDLRIGVDQNTFPISKTYTIGLNIGL